MRAQRTIRGMGPSNSTVEERNYSRSRVPRVMRDLRSSRRLSEFCSILQSNFLDLLSSEPLWRCARRTADFTEEAVQAGRRHHPEHKQFVIRIFKSMPCVFRYEDRGAL